MKKPHIALLGALGLGAIFAFAPLANAADQQPPAARGQRGIQGARNQEFMKKMAEELKLTDEQKKKIEETSKAQMAKMQKLRQDTSLSQAERRAEMTKIREENTKKMKEILTKDQYEKYQKMLAEQRQNRGRNRGGQGGGNTQ